MKRIAKRILLLTGILSFLFVVQGILVLSFQSPLRTKKEPFSGNQIHNPYQSGGEGFKSAFHLHSDSVWYTPERHSVSDIVRLYKKEGYISINFSDYGMITRPTDVPSIVAYEWGNNINKRHAQILFSNEIFLDLFPLYSFPENWEYVFLKAKQKGAFVSINHPSLYKAISKESILQLESIDAVEVFSPYGDNVFLLDKILSSGKAIKCMSGDDLHYFGEKYIREFDQSTFKNFIQHLFLVRNRKGRETFKRYIVFFSESPDSKNQEKSIREGNYLCIKKNFSDVEDPSVPRLSLAGNKILVEMDETPLVIRWIGDAGKVKKEIAYTKSGSYEVDSSDTYIRVEIHTANAKILSNPFYWK